MIKAETEQKIVRMLYEQNAWWGTGRVSSELSKPFKRRDFHILKNKLLEKEITAIVGPRQVGKTTLLYQLIENLLQEKNVNPRRVLYASFDYPYLSTLSKTPVNDIFEVYSAQILHEPIQKLKERIYIFFDEICKLEKWSSILKGWYDLKYPIKFVISDSSSTDILKGSSEALVGRINPHIMLSLKFIDVLMYFEKNFDFNQISWNLRRAFQKSVAKTDPRIFYDSIKEIFQVLIPLEETIKMHLQKYLLKDGYPELLDIESLITCREKLRNYLTLTLYKDIMRIFGVRDPKALEELVTLLASGSSQRVEYSNLSGTLSIKRDTLLKYLNYLDSVFLISMAEFYSKSRALRIRKTRKIYLTNVGLRNVLTGTLDESLLRDSVELGKVVETVVHEHCKRLKFSLEPGVAPKIYYWRTSRGEEVDIILELARQLIPIEVKYRNEISSRELRGLHEFLNEHEKSFGVVITKDLLDLRGRIVYLPLWLFLLMC